MEKLDKLSVYAGSDTDALVSFIFRQLPDAQVDQIGLDRIAGQGGGVARELITTAAVLSFSSALALPIFRLVERWMEQERQKRAMKLIYEAARETPQALEILAELEKKHTEVSVQYRGEGFRLPGSRGNA
jgi:hypothetical protein